MLRKYLLISVICIAPSVWAANPQSALEGLDLPQRLTISFQGGISSYPQDLQQEIIRNLHRALRTARDLAPEGHRGFFSSERLRGRRFQILITDQPEVRLRGKPIAMRSTSATLASHPSRDVQELTAILRVDPLIVDGRLIESAGAILTVDLLEGIYSVWEEHLAHPIQKAIDPFQQIELIRSGRQRGLSFFQGLLFDPRIIQIENPGTLLGCIFNKWLQGQAMLSGKLNVAPDFLPVPFYLHWPGVRNSSVDPQILFRALHLVFVLSIDDTGNVFSGFDGRDPILHRKDISINLYDSRKIEERPPFLRGPLAIDQGNWSPSETVIAIEAPYGLKRLLAKLLFRRDSAGFHVLLWTDQLLYQEDGSPDPDALAKLTLGLASQLNGPVRRFLPRPIRAIDATVSQLRAARTFDLAYSIGLVEKLRNHPLWNTLSVEEKASFVKVRNTYFEEVERLSCNNWLENAAQMASADAAPPPEPPAQN